MGRTKAVNQEDIVAKTVQEAFPCSTIVQKSEVCSLWAGYGSIYRILLNTGESLIVKHVTPPESNSVSNERKVRSYEVEGNFYKNLSQLSEESCLPQAYSIVSTGGTFCFILEDLATSFPKSFYSLSGETLTTALTWLANFHATYWNNTDEGVADTGGYWYLATRQEELESMGNDPLSRKLHAQANNIDKKTRDPRYETLLHGDAKSANMLWKDATSCAWVDFQYVGRGLGARDVAYLLCSSASRAEVLNSDAPLRHYFNAFLAAMSRCGQNNHGYTWELFQTHFDWCLLDYVRFMAGWGFWGNSEWAINKTKNLLD